MDAEMTTEAEMRLAEMQATGSMTNEDEKRLSVKFYDGAVLNPEESKKKGRPIFDNVPKVKIVVRGDKNNIVDRPVWDDPLNPLSDTSRFAASWKAYQDKREQVTDSGTPLSAWPAISRAQVEEFRPFRINTVEQLAAIPDDLGAKFPGIQGLKARARDFLKAAAGAAPAAEMRAELEKRDSALDEMKRMLKEQAAAMKEQAEQIAQLTKPPTPVQAPAPQTKSK